jgi:hypothetical protein
MKKYFLLALFLPLLGAGGISAQVSVSNMATDYPASKVSFTITWTAQPYNNQIWVIVDYIKVQNASTAGNSWKRALVTAVAKNAGAGSVATVAGQRGFWLNTSGSSGNANVTATLSLDAGVQQYNWCAYALNYPPKAELQPDGSYKLYGTPPFTVNGTTLPAGSLTVGPGTCITSLADATDNPSADLPAVLTVSTSNPATRCGEGAVTLAATASGGVTSSMTYTWTVGGGAAQTTSANTYAPTVAVGGATYSVTATNAAGCSSAAKTGTITVHALPTITYLSGSTAQTITIGSAITDIKYTTANASGATLTAGSFPAGVTGTWANNTYTVSGTPTATGTFDYTITTTNSNGCSNPQATGKIVVNSPDPFDSGSTWSCGSQVWSGMLRNPAGCSGVSTLSTDNPPSQAQYKDNGTSYGYYYNWTCVNTYASTLCPSPWRVPDESDLDALVLCAGLSGGALASAWGLPGYAYSSAVTEVRTSGRFWASAEASITHAASIYYDNTDRYLSYANKRLGYQVRCVK